MGVRGSCQVWGTVKWGAAGCGGDPTEGDRQKRGGGRVSRREDRRLASVCGHLQGRQAPWSARCWPRGHLLTAARGPGPGVRAGRGRTAVLTIRTGASRAPGGVRAQPLHTGAWGGEAGAGAAMRRWGSSCPRPLGRPDPGRWAWPGSWEDTGPALWAAPRRPRVWSSCSPKRHRTGFRARGCPASKFKFSHSSPRALRSPSPGHLLSRQGWPGVPSASSQEGQGPGGGHWGSWDEDASSAPDL